MSRYTQRYDGEGWEEKSGKLFKLACCDCGLVHDMVLVAGRGVVGIASRRNNRATAARRRRFGGANRPKVSPRVGVTGAVPKRKRGNDRSVKNYAGLKA